MPLAGGVVPKSRSGHRNHVNTPWDTGGDAPPVCRADGIDDLRRTVIEALRALAAAGPEGTAALNAVTDAVRRLHGAV